MMPSSRPESVRTPGATGRPAAWSSGPAVAASATVTVTARFDMTGTAVATGPSVPVTTAASTRLAHPSALTRR